MEQDILTEVLGEIITVNKRLDDVRFNNAKFLLKTYRKVIWQIESSINILDMECYEFGGKHLNELTDYLIDFDTMIDKERFESRLRGINVSKSLIEIIDKSLTMIKCFPNTGEQYFEILYFQYIASKTLKEKELLDKLNFERSKFYRMKKEAIKLLAVALWGYILPSLKYAQKKELKHGTKNIAWEQNWDFFETK